MAMKKNWKNIYTTRRWACTLLCFFISLHFLFSQAQSSPGGRDYFCMFFWGENRSPRKQTTYPKPKSLWQSPRQPVSRLRPSRTRAQRQALLENSTTATYKLKDVWIPQVSIFSPVKQGSNMYFTRQIKEDYAGRTTSLVLRTQSME